MLAQDVMIGNYRKGILETVSAVKPNLGQDNIFYFFTDHTGFWEFQSGFGQTLAVWLYDTGKISKEALTDRDYWDLSYEGIKSYKKGKYGYFMTYSKLLTALSENRDIPISSVRSFYWDYQHHSVKDVSVEIQNRLVADLIKHKPR